MFEISVLISFAPPKLEWWAFLIMAFSVFAAILLINFFVKKVNDAKIEERYKLMYARCTNQGTQVKESLDLEHRDPKKSASVSFVHERKQKLKKKDTSTQSIANSHHDKYISDWMIVYGRNKNNGNVGQERNRLNIRRSNKDTHLTEADHESENSWFSALLNEIVTTAVVFKENVAALTK